MDALALKSELSQLEVVTFEVEDVIAPDNGMMGATTEIVIIREAASTSTSSCSSSCCSCTSTSS